MATVNPKDLNLDTELNELLKPSLNEEAVKTTSSLIRATGEVASLVESSAGILADAAKDLRAAGLKSLFEPSEADKLKEELKTELLKKKLQALKA